MAASTDGRGGYRGLQPFAPYPKAAPMILLRCLIGDALRRVRLEQGRTLREVSAAARVSLGYLSEVERGQKEASSELLAAICTALDLSLGDVLDDVSDEVRRLEGVPVLSPVRSARHSEAATLTGPVVSVSVAA